VARFGSANEHSDWETAHHVFTYANAVHQMLKRIEGANHNFEAVRGVLHGSMALYLARYLNVPPGASSPHCRCGPAPFSAWGSPGVRLLPARD
jgi:hypothetical protein